MTSKAPAPAEFKVNVPDADIEDLHRRLASTRWPEDFGNESWTYGVEREWLAEMVRYWREDFDWRAHESAINQWPQFRVEIEGVPIHYIHAKGKGPDPIPLILTHGWPWTFWDYKDLIGPLTDPAAYGGDPVDAFELVVPSLPGYGFSVPLRMTGVDVSRVADLWVRLMSDVVGHPRFAAEGGDWGGSVTAEMGFTYPENLIGCLLTIPVLPRLTAGDVSPDEYGAEERWMITRMAEADRLCRSHFTTHRTDPQTIAYGLTDSPTGLAAWLWERRRGWSDCDGDILSVFDRDFLCTTASIYWFTKSISSSLRLYYETCADFVGSIQEIGTFRAGPRPADPVRLEVPTGYLIFPKDLLFLPRSVVAEYANLQRWTIMAEGGHFGPAERPADVIEETREFFRPLR